jgi:hypothetical protein
LQLQKNLFAAATDFVYSNNRLSLQQQEISEISLQQQEACFAATREFFAAPREFFAAAREHFAVARDFLRFLGFFFFFFFRSSKRMIFSFLMVFFL